MFLTATVRHFENGNEYGKERPRINFMFATDRRSKSKLSKSGDYALGFAAWSARIMND